MKKSQWVGGVLAGVVVFIWGFLSWVVLPVHEGSFLKFKDEAAVTAAIKAGAEKSGVYLLPYHGGDAAGLTPEQVKARDEAAEKQWQTGPSMLAVVRVHGVMSMTPNLLIGLITQIAGGLLIAGLLSCTSGLSYWAKVGFVMIVAVTIGVLSLVPEWNWWGFSLSYVGAMAIDYVVGWFLGGLVLARYS